MTQLRLGIAGLGVVGGGLLQILLNTPERLVGGGIVIDVVGVCARNKNRDRGVSFDGIAWYDDPVALARADEVDVFVELMGGADGPARLCVEAALEAGKHVVTANKALIAEHGQELASLAEEKGVALLFEAAVAGGVPVIRALRGGYAACDVERITGILNGTCNYILSEMTKTGADFDSALKDAQRLGYAEADPSFDIGGIDAAHKLAILSNIGFDMAIDFSSIPVEGIESISAADIKAADKLGYGIKLLGCAMWEGNAPVLRVHPALLSHDHILAQSNGPGNVVVIEGRPLGQVVLCGPGAGAGATAAAVAADIVSIARGERGAVFNAFAVDLPQMAAPPIERQSGQFYVRQAIKDVPGAMAAITEGLAKNNVSIASLVQPSSSDEGDAEIVLITHRVEEQKLRRALGEISDYNISAGVPSVIRIELFE